jgi:ABC-type Zn2+ transport system substrate-binding protein/surface adhesin
MPHAAAIGYYRRQSGQRFAALLQHLNIVPDDDDDDDDDDNDDDDDDDDDNDDDDNDTEERTPVHAQPTPIFVLTKPFRSQRATARPPARFLRETPPEAAMLSKGLDAIFGGEHGRRRG